MPRPTDEGADPVVTAIDGATSDISVSSDAMRWSPELAEDRRTAGGPGLPACAGWSPGRSPRWSAWPVTWSPSSAS